MFRVDPVIDAQKIFAVVERVWLLERYVVADRAVSERGGKSD